MNYRIRKGLETPCKIKGFLSTDYWLLVGWLSLLLILFFLGIRSGIMSSQWDSFFQVILLGACITPILFVKLRNRARSKKYDEIRKDLIISNLSLFKRIQK